MKKPERPVPSVPALDAGTDQALAWIRDCREVLENAGPAGRLYLTLAGVLSAPLREQFPGVPAGRVLMSVVQGLLAMRGELAKAGLDDPGVILSIAGLAAGQLEREAAAEPPPPRAVPRGRYAGGGRSPVAWVFLCPACAGYPPAAAEGAGFFSGRCQGCGCHADERHRFMAVINSAAGCGCTTGHPPVAGDLPQSAGRYAWRLIPPPGDPGAEVTG